jgi:AhpD family alkylhydroperoxidase
MSKVVSAMRLLAARSTEQRGEMTMMSTFAVHTPETAPEASKVRLAEVAKAWGFVPKLHGILAESPVALEAYDTLFGLVAKSSLTPAEQQVVYMAINVFHECEYCTMGHTLLSRRAGLPETEIQALRNGQPLTDGRLEALRRFAEAVVRERGFVGDAAVERFLGAGFSKANVLEVVTIAATKVIANYTNHVAHTPKEAFMSDPALVWVAPRNRRAAA